MLFSHIWLLPLLFVWHSEWNRALWANTKGLYRMTLVSVNQGLPTFLCERSTLVIVGCWSAGHMWKNIKWCALIGGLCPRVGEPCCKWNCMLNLWLCKLQLSCSFCCVITWAIRMCRGVECESHISTCSSLSITISVIPKSGRWESPTVW